MTLTSSRMLPLGTQLPFFELEVLSVLDANNFQSKVPRKTISNKSLLSKPLLLMILCAHCPFVKHVEDELARLDIDYSERVQIFGVASNSLITHPQDGPDYLLAQVKDKGWTFPYLLDHDQCFAKALQAACTPDFFLFAPSDDGVQKLCYRGQLDGSRPGNQIPVTGVDLRLAIDAVLSGEDVSTDQKSSIGCNIKWHPGKEPNWFG